MKKIKLYRYVGRNGFITTPILLDDIKHYVYYKIIPEYGKLITNGEKSLSYTIIPEEELDQWYEIDDPNGQL